MPNKEKNKLLQIIKKTSHDIRSPLSVINGYLQYRKNQDMTEEEQEYWNATQVCLDRILESVDVLSATANNKKSPLISNTKASASQVQPEIAENTNDLILVVDDDQDIQIHWKHTLQKLGLKYLGINSGEALLSMAIDYKNVSAAIVDYEFDNSSLNGFDIIEYLQRKKVPHIHLCTGLFNNQEIKTQAEEHGIKSIISKPIPENIDQMLSHMVRNE